MKKNILLSIFLLLMVSFTSQGQYLSAGDLAFLSVNSDNADEFTVVLMVDLPGGTIFHVTDNGFVDPVTGRTGEGFLTFTTPAEGYTKGQVFTWANGMSISGTPWNSASPTNFAFNASGDQLFLFQGSTSNWTTQTGITLLAGMHYSGGTWITSGSATASTSYQPSALNPAYILSFTEDNGYFADGTTPATSVTKSDTKENLLVEFFDINEWHKSDNRLTIPTYSITITSGGLLSPPVLNPDVTNNNVDYSVDVTFTDDATWRAAVTEVKVNGTTLTPVTDYVLTAGNLQLIPAGGNPLLTTSGSKAIAILATGYNNATVTQELNAGEPTLNSTAFINSPLILNATRTVTCTAYDQYNNPVPNYGFVFDLTITNNSATTTENYTIDGNSYSSSGSNLSLENPTNANGVVTFDITIPATVDFNDGMSLQVQLVNGTTNIGSSFAYLNQLPIVTLTGSDPSAMPFYRNTVNNILYKVGVTVTNNSITLTEANFLTGGTYTSADIQANGFTLWYSADANLTGSDVSLGTLSATTGAGEFLTFTGLNQLFSIGSGYLFLTVNTSPAATLGNLISGQIYSNSDLTFTETVSFSGSTFPAANPHAIIGDPAFTELVIPQYIGGKNNLSTNEVRTPAAFCFEISNLMPNTAYDINAQMGLITDAANLYGAGNLWNGTSYNGSFINNVFTTDASGNSGPVWIYVQPTGNARYEPGNELNLRVGYRINGGSFPGSPNFISTSTTRTLDIVSTPRTSATTDDGAFIRGIANSNYSGKYVLIFDNVMGNGNPLNVYMVRNATPTNSSQAQLPVVINDIYSQSGSSAIGDFPAVIPVGANNPSGIKRIEFRNADNSLYMGFTSADGDWGNGAVTTAIGRAEVQTLDLFEPTQHATAFTAGTTTTTTIPLTWTDATGLVLPEFYLIKGSDVGFESITDPADGVAEPNSALIQNVAFGIQEYTFTGLTPNTTYFFKIFPYTGSGSLINYKTGVNTPEATATTLAVAINKTLDVTIFMEGPFNGTDMNTDLNTSGLIPLQNPYTLEAPVASIPVGAVDWVLVDLRDADVPANAVPATRLAGWPKAYFVRNDGQIIDANGNLPDIGSPTVGGGLFIVIRHRNHIDVMSAYPASLSGNTYSYDFTGSLGQAYSLGAGYKEIGTGIFGMVSGDTDADGAVFTSDFNAWAGQFGNDDVYENADLDMDGSVFTSDFNKWAGNFGSDNLIEGGKTLTPMYTSQVPGDIK